jgi:hypothetical protein
MRASSSKWVVWFQRGESDLLFQSSPAVVEVLEHGDPHANRRPDSYWSPADWPEAMSGFWPPLPSLPKSPREQLAHFDALF